MFIFNSFQISYQVFFSLMFFFTYFTVYSFKFVSFSSFRYFPFSLIFFLFLFFLSFLSSVNSRLLSSACFFFFFLSLFMSSFVFFFLYKMVVVSIIIVICIIVLPFFPFLSFVTFPLFYLLAQTFSSLFNISSFHPPRFVLFSSIPLLYFTLFYTPSFLTRLPFSPSFTSPLTAHLLPSLSPFSSLPSPLFFPALHFLPIFSFCFAISLYPSSILPSTFFPSPLHLSYHFPPVHSSPSVCRTLSVFPPCQLAMFPPSCSPCLCVLFHVVLRLAGFFCVYSSA